jgi:hypothetical protein
MSKCRDWTGTSLWWILRQIKAERGESKILKIDGSRYRVGAPHEVASEVYDRFFRIYKVLYADLDKINSKFIRRFRTNGNFFYEPYHGVGFVKMGKKYYHPSGIEAEKSGLSIEDYRNVVSSAVDSRNKLMETKNFQKLHGEARTLKILTEEMRGIINGKARISREQSYRTTKRTTINRDVINDYGCGNQ